MGFLSEFMALEPKMQLSVFENGYYEKEKRFDYLFEHAGIHLEIRSENRIDDFKEIELIAKKVDKSIGKIKMDVALKINQLEIRVWNINSQGQHFLSEQSYNPMICMNNKVSDSMYIVYSGYNKTLSIVSGESIIHWFENPTETFMDYLYGKIDMKFEEFAICIEGKISYAGIRQTITKEFGENTGFRVDGDIAKVIRWDIHKKGV